MTAPTDEERVRLYIATLRAPAHYVCRFDPSNPNAPTTHHERGIVLSPAEAEGLATALESALSQPKAEAAAGKAAQAPVAAHRWPFVESPGEIANRAQEWLAKEFCGVPEWIVLAAIRYAIIERGHTLATPPAQQVEQLDAARLRRALLDLMAITPVGTQCTVVWDRCRKVIRETDAARAQGEQVAAKGDEMSDEDDLVTVCDHCLRASCWQYIFLCDRYREAGTTRKTVRDLRALSREHPDYWRPAAKQEKG